MISAEVDDKYSTKSFTHLEQNDFVLDRNQGYNNCSVLLWVLWGGNRAHGIIRVCVWRPLMCWWLYVGEPVLIFHLWHTIVVGEIPVIWFVLSAHILEAARSSTCLHIGPLTSGETQICTWFLWSTGISLTAKVHFDKMWGETYAIHKSERKLNKPVQNRSDSLPYHIYTCVCACVCNMQWHAWHTQVCAMHITDKIVVHQQFDGTVVKY